MSGYQEHQCISEVASLIAVVRLDGHFRLTAAQDVEEGTTLSMLTGKVYPRATRYSVQIGMAEHVDADPARGFEESLDLYPWRCLNHSCRPNAVFRGRRLVALRDIQAWEQITFDYNTTEFELATPFRCTCGEANCCGMVRGFKHLTVAQRQQRAPLVADYLHVLVQSAS